MAQELTQGASMQVPYGNLVISLISLTIPMGLGVAIRWWRPIWAERGAKIIKPFTLVVIIFFMSVSRVGRWKGEGGEEGDGWRGKRGDKEGKGKIGEGTGEEK